MLPAMKSYTRILAVIGVVLVVAAGVWYWKFRDTTTVVIDATPSPSGSLVPLASVTPLPVAYDAAGADWKTYASASAGFKVSYPATWTVGECGPGCVGWVPPTGQPNQFAFGIIQSTSTIADVLKNAEPFLADRAEIKAGANTWVKLTLQQPTTGEVVTSHFIEHGGKLFEFGTATSDASVLAVYGSMIRSLVFTK